MSLQMMVFSELPRFAVAFQSRWHKKLEYSGRPKTDHHWEGWSLLANNGNQKYTKSYQQDCCDWPRHSSRKMIRLQAGMKHVGTTWMDKTKFTDNKLTCFLWTPMCRTISLHLFSVWDTVSAFTYKRKHGVPKFLQREHSYLTNVFWAQMALAALTSSFSNCR